MKRREEHNTQVPFTSAYSVKVLLLLVAQLMAIDWAVTSFIAVAASDNATNATNTSTLTPSVTRSLLTTPTPTVTLNHSLPLTPTASISSTEPEVTSWTPPDPMIDVSLKDIRRGRYCTPRFLTSSGCSALDDYGISPQLYLGLCTNHCNATPVQARVVSHSALIMSGVQWRRKINFRPLGSGNHITNVSAIIIDTHVPEIAINFPSTTVDGFYLLLVNSTVSSGITIIAGKALTNVRIEIIDSSIGAEWDGRLTMETIQDEKSRVYLGGQLRLAMDLAATAGAATFFTNVSISIKNSQITNYNTSTVVLEEFNLLNGLVEIDTSTLKTFGARLHNTADRAMIASNVLCRKVGSPSGRYFTQTITESALTVDLSTHNPANPSPKLWAFNILHYNEAKSTFQGLAITNSSALKNVGPATGSLLSTKLALIGNLLTFSVGVEALTIRNFATFSVEWHVDTGSQYKGQIGNVMLTYPSPDDEVLIANGCTFSIVQSGSTPMSSAFTHLWAGDSPMNRLTISDNVTMSSNTTAFKFMAIRYKYPLRDSFTVKDTAITITTTGISRAQDSCIAIRFQAGRAAPLQFNADTVSCTVSSHRGMQFLLLENVNSTATNGTSITLKNTQVIAKLSPAAVPANSKGSTWLQLSTAGATTAVLLFRTTNDDTKTTVVSSATAASTNYQIVDRFVVTIHNCNFTVSDELPAPVADLEAIDSPALNVSFKTIAGIQFDRVLLKAPSIAVSSSRIAIHQTAADPSWNVGDLVADAAQDPEAVQSAYDPSGGAFFMSFTNSTIIAPFIMIGSGSTFTVNATATLTTTPLLSCASGIFVHSVATAGVWDITVNGSSTVETSANYELLEDGDTGHAMDDKNGTLMATNVQFVDLTIFSGAGETFFTSHLSLEEGSTMKALVAMSNVAEYTTSSSKSVLMTPKAINVWMAGSLESAVPLSGSIVSGDAAANSSLQKRTAFEVPASTATRDDNFYASFVKVVGSGSLLEAAIETDRISGTGDAQNVRFDDAMHNFAFSVSGGGSAVVKKVLSPTSGSTTPSGDVCNVFLVDKALNASTISVSSKSSMVATTTNTGKLQSSLLDFLPTYALGHFATRPFSQEPILNFNITISDSSTLTCLPCMNLFQFYTPTIGGVVTTIQSQSSVTATPPTFVQTLSWIVVASILTNVTSGQTPSSKDFVTTASRSLLFGAAASHFSTPTSRSPEAFTLLVDNSRVNVTDPLTSCKDSKLRTYSGLFYTKNLINNESDGMQDEEHVFADQSEAKVVKAVQLRLLSSTIILQSVFVLPVTVSTGSGFFSFDVTDTSLTLLGTRVVLFQFSDTYFVTPTLRFSGSSSNSTTGFSLLRMERATLTSTRTFDRSCRPEKPIFNLVRHQTGKAPIIRPPPDRISVHDVYAENTTVSFVSLPSAPTTVKVTGDFEETSLLHFEGVSTPPISFGSSTLIDIQVTGAVTAVQMIAGSSSSLQGGGPVIRQIEFVGTSSVKVITSAGAYARLVGVSNYKIQSTIEMRDYAKLELRGPSDVIGIHIEESAFDVGSGLVVRSARSTDLTASGTTTSCRVAHTFIESSAISSSTTFSIDGDVDINVVAAQVANATFLGVIHFTSTSVASTTSISIAGSHIIDARAARLIRGETTTSRSNHRWGMEWDTMALLSMRNTTTRSKVNVAISVVPAAFRVLRPTAMTGNDFGEVRSTALVTIANGCRLEQLALIVSLPRTGTTSEIGSVNQHRHVSFGVFVADSSIELPSSIHVNGSCDIRVDSTDNTFKQQFIAVGVVRSVVRPNIFVENVMVLTTGVSGTTKIANSPDFSGNTSSFGLASRFTSIFTAVVASNGRLKGGVTARAIRNAGNAPAPISMLEMYNNSALSNNMHIQPESLSLLNATNSVPMSLIRLDATTLPPCIVGIHNEFTDTTTTESLLEASSDSVIRVDGASYRTSSTASVTVSGQYQFSWMSFKGVLWNDNNYFDQTPVTVSLRSKEVVLMDIENSTISAGLKCEVRFMQSQVPWTTERFIGYRVHNSNIAAQLVYTATGGKVVLPKDAPNTTLFKEDVDYDFSGNNTILFKPVGAQVGHFVSYQTEPSTTSVFPEAEYSSTFRFRGTLDVTNLPAPVGVTTTNLLFTSIITPSSQVEQRLKTVKEFDFGAKLIFSTPLLDWQFLRFVFKCTNPQRRLPPQSGNASQTTAQNSTLVSLLPPDAATPAKVSFFVELLSTISHLMLSIENFHSILEVPARTASLFNVSLQITPYGIFTIKSTSLLKGSPTSLVRFVNAPAAANNPMDLVMSIGMQNVAFSAPDPTTTLGAVFAFEHPISFELSRIRLQNQWTRTYFTNYSALQTAGASKSVGGIKADVGTSLYLFGCVKWNNNQLTAEQATDVKHMFSPGNIEKSPDPGTNKSCVYPILATKTLTPSQSVSTTPSWSSPTSALRNAEDPETKTASRLPSPTAPFTNTKTLPQTPSQELTITPELATPPPNIQQICPAVHAPSEFTAAQSSVKEEVFTEGGATLTFSAEVDDAALKRWNPPLDVAVPFVLRLPDDRDKGSTGEGGVVGGTENKDEPTGLKKFEPLVVSGRFAVNTSTGVQVEVTLPPHDELEGYNIYFDEAMAVYAADFEIVAPPNVDDESQAATESSRRMSSLAVAAKNITQLLRSVCSNETTRLIGRFTVVAAEDKELENTRVVAEATTIAVTSLSVVAGGGGAVGDQQAMSVASMMSCAGPSERKMLTSYRLLAPFATSEDFIGVVYGNIILFGAITVLCILVSLVKLCIDRKNTAKRKAKDADDDALMMAGALLGDGNDDHEPQYSERQRSFYEALAYSRFPSLPYKALIVTLQGTSFAAFQIVGNVSRWSTHEYGISVATLTFVIGAVPAIYIYSSLRIHINYSTYLYNESETISKTFPRLLVSLLFPRGQWHPEVSRKRFGGWVSSNGRQERLWTTFPLWSPLIMSIGSFFNPGDTGCVFVFSSLAGAQFVVALVSLIAQPHRSRLVNILAALGSSLVAAYLVLSALQVEDPTPRKLSLLAAITQSQIALTIVRVVTIISILVFERFVLKDVPQEHQFSWLRWSLKQGWHDDDDTVEKKDFFGAGSSQVMRDVAPMLHVVASERADVERSLDSGSSSSSSDSSINDLLMAPPPETEDQGPGVWSQKHGEQARMHEEIQDGLSYGLEGEEERQQEKSRRQSLGAISLAVVNDEIDALLFSPPPSSNTHETSVTQPSALPDVVNLLGDVGELPPVLLAASDETNAAEAML